MSRPISVDEVASFPYAGVDECDLSADGLRIAYTHQGQIYITDLETSNVSEPFKGRSPKWSPSQPDVLAFLKPESSGVWIRYIDGTERQFGKNTQDVNFVQWSFDGQFIALIVNRDLEIQDEDNDADIVIVSPPPLTTVSEIVTLHVDTDEVTFLAKSKVGEFYEGLVWHPDGNWLTVHSAIESQNQRDTDWCLFDIDRRSGVRKNRIGPGKNEMTLPSWSPCGNFLALGYSPYSYIHPVRNLCAIMERDSKQVQILNDEYFIDFVCWGDDGGKIYCSGLKGISRHVFNVDIRSGRKEVVVERTGWTYLSGISHDGRTLMTVFRGLLSLPDIRVISLDPGLERTVTRFSDQLTDYELADAAVVEWESYDGLTIQGCVVSPLGKLMSPEHPTIVDVHGGPTEGGAAIFYREWHWLAANGFQIFAPDMRGSQQYQWCEPPTQEPDYKDVMSGIDWLASQQMCDKARMGVHGYSYGAILGAYAIGKSTLFRAAVLLGGLYDYRLTCQSDRQTRWNAISAQETGGAPWEVPHLYQELSPISYVANVETPVLILEGEHDTPYEAELYTTYLKALGKEVTYVLYKGAGHSLSKAAHRKDRWERTLRWFRKYLFESD